MYLEEYILLDVEILYLFLLSLKTLDSYLCKLVKERLYWVIMEYFWAI